MVPGVKFTIAKMSFGRRVELMRRVRELARRTEFLAASEDAGDKMDAALLRAEIERMYVVWGVKAVSGLDGGRRARRAPELLAEAGPEELFREALAAVRQRDRASAKKKEKTPSRLPFSIFQPGRLGVRRMPEVRPGSRRRCGWLELPDDGRAAPVWARKTVASRAAPSRTLRRRARDWWRSSWYAAGWAGSTSGVERAAGGGISDSGAGAGRRRSSPQRRADGDRHGEHNTRRGCIEHFCGWTAGAGSASKRTARGARDEARMASTTQDELDYGSAFCSIGPAIDSIGEASAMLADVIAQLGEVRSSAPAQCRRTRRRYGTSQDGGTAAGSWHRRCSRAGSGWRR